VSNTGGRPPSTPPLIGGLVDPRLTGAACRGRAPWFDDYVEGESIGARSERLAAAERICIGCPVRSACHTAAGEHQATGVWAGRIRETPTKFDSTRKKAAS
jgi:WhiB family redox-sensing transcriptional regulator